MAHSLPNETFATCNGAIYCSFKWLYDVTNGFAPTGLLLGFCVVLLMATTNRFGTTRAFGFSSVVGLLGAIWLATMQLMPWWIASMFILVGGVGFAAMIISEK